MQIGYGIDFLFFFIDAKTDNRNVQPIRLDRFSVPVINKKVFGFSIGISVFFECATGVKGINMIVCNCQIRKTFG